MGLQPPLLPLVAALRFYLFLTTGRIMESEVTFLLQWFGALPPLIQVIGALLLMEVAKGILGLFKRQTEVTAQVVTAASDDAKRNDAMQQMLSTAIAALAQNNTQQTDILKNLGNVLDDQQSRLERIDSTTQHTRKEINGRLLHKLVQTIVVTTEQQAQTMALIQQSQMQTNRMIAYLIKQHPPKPKEL